MHRHRAAELPPAAVRVEQLLDLVGQQLSERVAAERHVEQKLGGDVVAALVQVAPREAEEASLVVPARARQRHAPGLPVADPAQVAGKQVERAPGPGASVLAHVQVRAVHARVREVGLGDGVHDGLEALLDVVQDPVRVRNRARRVEQLPTRPPEPRHALGEVLDAAVVVAVAPHVVRGLDAPGRPRLFHARAQMPLLPVDALVERGPLVARTGHAEVEPGRAAQGQAVDAVGVGAEVVHEPFFAGVLDKEMAEGVHGPVRERFEGWLLHDVLE